jgi:hypothetical protein
VDYQLFLVSGMREAYAHDVPARAAITVGLRHGRAVVTAAAIIMVAVFGGFVFSELTLVRPLGLGLAVGVLFDAFVVRMLLVPALMHVSGGDASFAQLVQHSDVIDAQVVADSRQGPAEVVEVDGVVDLLRRETAAAHRHAVPVENGADRPPFDAEPVTELVHRRAGLVVGDQLLDLIGMELSGAAGAVALDRRRLGGIEAGKLLT